MKLKLNLNLKALVQKASTVLPVIFGLALIGVFGYTAFLINTALNLQPSTTTAAPPPKIVFDKKTILYIQGLNKVPGQTGVTSVGKNNPFGN